MVNLQTYRRLGWFLTVAGLLLQLPAVGCSWNPSPDDVSLAMTPVVRLPFEHFREASSVYIVFEVPASEQWSKLEQRWGEPVYIVFGRRVEHSTRWILPFESLSLDVKVTQGNNTLALSKADSAPYLYSSETADYGLTFRPKKGEHIKVTIASRNGRRPTSGELSVEPLWPGEMKDRIVVALVEKDLRRYTRWTQYLGLIFMIIGVALTRGAPV